MNAPVLETKRLLLRPLREEDAADIAEGLNHKEMSEYVLRIPYPYTLNDAEEYLKKRLQPNNNRYVFGIELKKEHKLIGQIVLHMNETEKGLASTSSWMSKNYQHNKYITEAKITVNDYAFGTLNIHKLWTNILTGNIASIKTQEKMGYVREGVLRQHYTVSSTNKVHDAIAFGLLRDEWNEHRQQLLDEIEQLE